MGEVAHEGMTLRDYFAAKAMATLSLCLLAGTPPPSLSLS